MGPDLSGDALLQFFRKCRRDPVFMVDALFPRKTYKVQGGKTLIHHGQRKWLREAFAPINVLVPGNRFGKSTVTGMRQFWFALTKFGAPIEHPDQWYAARYDTISLAYSSEQAGIVFNEIRSAAMSEAMRPLVQSVRESPYPKITLFNGSTITVRSAHDNGKYVDGFEYRYISLDEAGYIDDLKGLVNGVLLFRLAGGGLLDMLGTPKGFNHFYWYAERGLRKVPGYYTMRGSIFDNPFLGKKDIQMRDKLLTHSDPKLRQQVIEGDFVDFDGLAFGRDQRENAFDPRLPAHQDYVPGHQYVQAWDLGRTQDWTVGVTLDVTHQPWVMVDYVRLNRVPWEEIYRLIGEKRNEYHVNLPRIDASGPQGDVIEEELWKRGIHVDPYRISTGAIKVDLINALQTCLDWGRESIDEILVPDEAGIMHKVPVMEPPDHESDKWGLLRMPVIPQIVDEMGVYSLAKDRKLVQDSVIAVALAAHRAYEDLIVFEPHAQGLY